MPKQTDIVGTIRVPEEHYGRFWNFMRSMPTAEFSPVLSAEAPKKRLVGKTKEGSSMKCIILNALPLKGEGLAASELRELIVQAGKSEKSAPNALFELKKQGLAKQDARGLYLRTAKSQKFIAENCKHG